MVLSAALGLLAKPTLVTLPFVLLLLDAWPLRRFEPQRWSRLVLEKVPFFLLSVASAVATVVAQRHGGSVGSLGAIPFGERVANALVAYAAYLRKTVWPSGLACFYPHPGSYGSRVELSALVGSGLLLLALTAAAVETRRTRPYFLVGWLWFLGMLVPMIGIVQVGMQALADRYAYLSQIGLLLILVWGAKDLARGVAARGLPVLALAACVVLGAVSWNLVRAWHDDVTLNERALRVTSNNFFAHNNLGVELLELGRNDDATAHFEAALRIKADYPDALNNLGSLRLAQGNYAESAKAFEALVRVRPDAASFFALGAARLRLGERAGAIALFGQALRIDSSHVDTLNALGVIAMQDARWDEALDRFDAALAARPDFADAHVNAGIVLRARGRLDEAAAHQQAALGAQPRNARARHELGLVWLARGDRERARANLQEAARLAPGDEGFDGIWLPSPPRPT